MHKTFIRFGFILLITIPFLIQAQSDCIVSTPLCSDGQIVFNPQGVGNVNDLNSSNNGCLEQLENNSAWYYFEINDQAPAGSELGFIIRPDASSGEDYDFALYGPNVTCGNLGTPIRCSYANSFCFFCPQTGLGMGATDTSEDPTGDGFVRTILVNPGEGYFLLVDNFGATGSGFSLDWTGDAAQYLNCDIVCELETSIDPIGPFCQGTAPINLNLNITTDLPDYSIIWESSSIALSWFNSLVIEDPELTIPPSFFGDLDFQVIISNPDGMCMDTAFLSITILEQPELNTLDSINIDCNNSTGVTLASGLITNPSFNYSWTLDGVSQGSNIPLTVNNSGDYILTASNGICTAMDTAWVTRDEGILDADIQDLSVICESTDLGTVVINNVQGMNGPFNVSIDGATPVQQDTFQNLSQGDHTAIVTDANNCTFPINFSIEEYLETTLFVADDTTVLKDSPLNYMVQTNLLDMDIQSIDWYFNGSLVCMNCPSYNFSAFEDGLLEIVLVNINGCDFRTSFFLTVETIEINLFAPNVFSPNGDNINDVFTVQGGEGIAGIDRMIIFNRWGDQVFSADNIPINENSVGWNGTFRSQKSPSGVYIYYIEVRQSNQQVVVLKGDVTLIR